MCYSCRRAFHSILLVSEVGTNQEKDRWKLQYKFFTHNILHTSCVSFCPNNLGIWDSWIPFIILPRLWQRWVTPGCTRACTHTHTHTQEQPLYCWQAELKRSQSQSNHPWAVCSPVCPLSQLVREGVDERSGVLLLQNALHTEMWRKENAYSPLMILRARELEKKVTRRSQATISSLLVFHHPPLFFKSIWWCILCWYCFGTLIIFSGRTFLKVKKYYVSMYLPLSTKCSLCLWSKLRFEKKTM